MNFKKLFRENQQIIIVSLVVVGLLLLLQYFSQENSDSQYKEYIDEMPELEKTVEFEEPEQIEDPEENLEEPTEFISPEELLPKNDMAAEFENQFPSGKGDLSAKNFLTAGYNVGINTVASSLRNANLQLRSDVYIPPKNVSPWGNSTILPDLNRKPMQIGS